MHLATILKCANTWRGSAIWVAFVGRGLHVHELAFLTKTIAASRASSINVDVLSGIWIRIITLNNVILTCCYRRVIHMVKSRLSFLANPRVVDEVIVWRVSLTGT